MLFPSVWLLQLVTLYTFAGIGFGVVFKSLYEYFSFRFMVGCVPIRTQIMEWNKRMSSFILRILNPDYNLIKKRGLECIDELFKLFE